MGRATDVLLAWLVLTLVFTALAVAVFAAASVLLDAWRAYRAGDWCSMARDVLLVSGAASFITLLALDIILDDE